MWQLESKAEQPSIDAISGYVFVKPTDSISYNLDVRKIQDTLQCSSSMISPHPKVTGAFRVNMGVSGREGSIAVTNFLNQKSNAFPRSVIFAREKTPITQGRVKCLYAIRNSLMSTISEKPDLKGLKVHVGANGSNLFLSYADRKEVFARNTQAKTYTYPVWEHIPLSDTLSQGSAGFIFDKNQIKHQDHAFLYNQILKIVPAAERTDVNMDANGYTNVRGRDDERLGGGRNKYPRHNSNNRDSSGNPGSSGVNSGNT